MKKERLDDILIRMGAVSEEQIKQALLRQKSRGGKLGTHLLYYRFLTEEQLIQGLAEQFSVSGIRLSDCEITGEILGKIPADVAETYRTIPFMYDREKGDLFVAVADPDNTTAITAIKRVSGVSKVIAYVAPEISIQNSISSLYHGRESDTLKSGIIDLPDLFEEEADEQSGSSAARKNTDIHVHTGSNVLLFTGQIFLKNILPSILEREGLNLTVVTSANQISESLRTSNFHRILVSEDVLEEFKRFVQEHKIRGIIPEVAVFRSVGSSLMENPVPYSQMIECMLKAVQHIAGWRTSDLSWSPPYALMLNEISEVGRIIGLSRIAIDGLRIALHLLLPGKEQKDTSHTPEQDMFGDLDSSIQIARSFSFPWDIPACLALLKNTILTGSIDFETMEDRKELKESAGILSLVWYRHTVLRSMSTGSRGEFELLKSKIRGQAGYLAPSSVVEAYIRIFEQTGRLNVAGSDIFVVGEVSSLFSFAITELRHHGFKIVEVKDLQEAKKLYLRCRPAAILIHIDESLSFADEFCRYIRADMGDSSTALFAVTRRNEPSFLLNLLDTWFSDVLTIPLNSQVVVARITNVISVSHKGFTRLSSQGFSATFKDLSFAELIQALGNETKNVHMHIEHSSGSQADVWFRQGRIVCAVSGREQGVEAVYRVIRWQDDGVFRIEPAKEFPTDNVTVPNDYILLEGSRLLDESETGV
jgi:hypothetical protein